MFMSNYFCYNCNRYTVHRLAVMYGTFQQICQEHEVITTISNNTGEQTWQQQT